MTKINLGNNGPLVSKLGLGCMRMSPVWGGPANDESESIATIQAALDNGINFLNPKLARVCGIDRCVAYSCDGKTKSQTMGVSIICCEVHAGLRNIPPGWAGTSICDN